MKILNRMFSDKNQRLVKCNTLGCDRIDRCGEMILSV